MKWKHGNISNRSVLENQMTKMIHIVWLDAHKQDITSLYLGMIIDDNLYK